MCSCVQLTEISFSYFPQKSVTLVFDGKLAESLAKDVVVELKAFVVARVRNHGRNQTRFRLGYLPVTLSVHVNP